MPQERLGCLANPNKACNCPFVRENAAQINAMGKDRNLGKTFQRHGFDKGGVGLINQLLKNPNGSYETRFDGQVRFSPEMLGIRNTLLRARWQLLLNLETNSVTFQCLELREKFASSGETNEKDYLAFLQSQLYLPRQK